MTRRERERCRHGRTELGPCEHYCKRCAEEAYCMRESMAADDEATRRKEEER